MKKILALTVALLISFYISACGSGAYSSQCAVNVELNKVKNQIKRDNLMSTSSGDVRIKMTFNNEEVIVKIYDNPSNRDFLTLLPLTLPFKDYAGTEKISYLPRKLSVKDAPPGCTPAMGDFTYYAPWGNLAIFYKNFQYSNELIILGKIESGMEKLANMRSEVAVRIEKID